MKLFELLQFLNEDRLDHFAKQQEKKILAAAENDPSLMQFLNPVEAKDAKAILTKLIGESDPTPTNKYTEYILKMYTDLDPDFHFEDSGRMRQALSTWIMYLPRIPVADRELRKNPETQTLVGLEEKARFLDALYSKESEEEVKSAKDEHPTLSKTEAHQKRAQHEGLEVLLDGADGTVYSVTTYKGAEWGAKAFGKPGYSENPNNWASWCTRGRSWYDNYVTGEGTNKGPLFIFDANGNEAFQIHLETGQVKNRKQLSDGRKTADQTGFSQASKYPTFKKFWNGLVNYTIIPSLKNGKYTAAGNYTKIQGKRSSKIEAEVLKHPEAIMHYCDTVIKGRWPEAEEAIMQDPEAIEKYTSKHFRYERWPEAEPMLLTNTKAALNYAKRSFNGQRWPELEHAILTNTNDDTASETAFKYTVESSKQRWPEAEPIILRDPTVSRDYHDQVYNGPISNDGRWPEFEEVLLDNFATDERNGVYRRSALIYLYSTKSLFKDNRWPELEEIIVDQPVAASWYSTIIMERRWPEAEKYILKSPVADQYKEKFKGQF